MRNREAYEYRGAPEAHKTGVHDKGVDVNGRDGVSVREAILHREVAYLLRQLAELRRCAEIAGREAGAVRGALDAQRVAFSEALAQKDIELSRLLVEERALREQVVLAFYQSRSWRVTRPLRRAANLIRKLMGRAIAGETQSVPQAVYTDAGRLLDDTGGYACLQSADAVQPGLVDAERPLPSDAHKRRTILVAADMLPLFDQSSGGLRLKTLIDQMSPLGWNVVFGSLTRREESPGVLSTPAGLESYENALRRSGVTEFLYGREDVLSYLQSRGDALDLAFLSFPHVTDALLPLVRSQCPRAKIVYDMVDFHGLRMAREAELTKSELLKKQADRQRDIEVACARSADMTLAINEEEKAALLALAPTAVVEVIPNVFAIPQQSVASDLAERRGLLFIGGFWHKPNGDAIAWFVDRIWPRIQSLAPDVTLTIAGSNPSDEVLALGARPGIEVLGYVPDVAPLLDSHRVSIAPLRWGAGAKGKVGQALAFGLPVATTSIGAEGMSLRNGEHLLVADDEEGFAANVLELLRDDELWLRLSASGREHMQGRFSIDVVNRKLKDVLNG